MRFLGESGIASISDFMAIKHLGHSHNLVRRVKVVRGEINFRMICAPKFDYGRTAHAIEKKSLHEVIFIPRGKNLPAICLRGSVPLKLDNGAAVAGFKLRAEQTAFFILEEMKGESPSLKTVIMFQKRSKKRDELLARFGWAACKLSRTLARNVSIVRRSR